MAIINSFNFGIARKIVANMTTESWEAIPHGVVTYGDDAFVGKGHQHKEDAELKKLLKENERLKMENEILKKAAAYFAKHPADE